MTRTTFDPSIKSPVFIVGCGHSGTSLMRSLLGMHPNLYAIPFETNIFRAPQKAYQQLAYMWPVESRTAQHSNQIPPYCSQECTDPAINLSIRILHGRTATQNKNRWVEKTPRHVYHLESILRIMPNAQIMIMIRDGRDVAVSLRDRFGGPDAFLAGTHRWIGDNLEGERYWHHPNVLRVKLEQLTFSFRDTMADVFRFLSEPYDPHIETYNGSDLDHIATLDADRPFATWEDYRLWLKCQPLGDTRGKWISRMSLDEKSLFKAVAGDMLVRYGYTVNDEW